MSLGMGSVAFYFQLLDKYYVRYLCFCQCTRLFVALPLTKSNERNCLMLTYAFESNQWKSAFRIALRIAKKSRSKLNITLPPVAVRQANLLTNPQRNQAVSFLLNCSTWDARFICEFSATKMSLQLSRDVLQHSLNSTMDFWHRITQAQIFPSDLGCSFEIKSQVMLFIARILHSLPQ